MSDVTNCQWCGGKLDKRKRSGPARKTCSDSCRKNLSRYLAGLRPKALAGEVMAHVEALRVTIERLGECTDPLAGKMAASQVARCATKLADTAASLNPEELFDS